MVVVVAIVQVLQMQFVIVNVHHVNAVNRHVSVVDAPKIMGIAFVSVALALVNLVQLQWKVGQLLR